jgi:hypothetical protein
MTVNHHGTDVRGLGNVPIEGHLDLFDTHGGTQVDGSLEATARHWR